MHVWQCAMYIECDLTAGMPPGREAGGDDTGYEAGGQYSELWHVHVFSESYSRSGDSGSPGSADTAEVHVDSGGTMDSLKSKDAHTGKTGSDKRGDTHVRIRSRHDSIYIARTTKDTGVT